MQAQALLLLQLPLPMGPATLAQPLQLLPLSMGHALPAYLLLLLPLLEIASLAHWLLPLPLGLTLPACPMLLLLPWSWPSWPIHCCSCRSPRCAWLAHSLL